MKICHIFFQGSVKFQKTYADRNIPYKYVIRKGDSGEIKWEKLPQPMGAIVNRRLNFPTNLTSYRKFDDVIWKNDAFGEKDPGKHALGRNIAIALMAPDKIELMNSNEVDDMIFLAIKTGNIRQSLGSKIDFNQQWLIEDGTNRCFQLVPPNFQIKSWIPHLKENFGFNLDHKDWFVRLKCCLFLPLATKYKAFTYVGGTGLLLVLKVTITYALF